MQRSLFKGCPYTIVIKAGRSLGFRIETNDQGATLGGAAVTSILDQTLISNGMQIGDVIVSLNGWKCLHPIPAEAINLKLAILPRPLKIVLQPTVLSRSKETLEEDMSRHHRGTSLATVHPGEISKSSNSIIVKVKKDPSANGKLDIVLAPPNREGNPPRIKAFVGRTQGSDPSCGPVQKSGLVRVGDLLIKVNNKSTINMTVKDIENKIYQSDRGFFNMTNDGVVTLEIRRPAKKKKLRRIDSLGNKRLASIGNGPAYTAKELSYMLDDMNVALENDSNAYGPAFDLRNVIHKNFGNKKEVQDIINEAFGLPMNHSQQQLDPLYCLSCNTLWRECCLQVERWLAQNDSTSVVNKKLKDILLDGWIQLVQATERVHTAVTAQGELQALIQRIQEDQEKDPGEGEEKRERCKRAELKEGLNVESLFAKFTVRWIEMQYNKFTSEYVPRMLRKAKWEPISFSDPNSRYDLTAKTLLYFINTCQKSFDMIPGHTKYPNIVRYGQNLLCDVVTFYADQITDDFQKRVIELIKTKEGRPIYGALYGLSPEDGPTGSQKTLLQRHGAPLACHINTILHMENMMMSLLENLNELEGVEGFMQDDDDDDDGDDEGKSGDAAGGTHWGDDLDDQSAVFNNLEVYQLKVICYEGKNIPKLDYGGLRPSDPYLVITLFDGERSSNVHHSTGKTSIVHNSESPKWGLPQEGHVSDNRVRSATIGGDSSTMDLSLIGEEINLETPNENVRECVDV
jgi:hypothetical protein